MAENVRGDIDEVVLAWQRGDGPGSVEFVLTSAHAEEMLALFAEEGVSAKPDPITRLLRTWREWRDDDIQETGIALERSGYEFSWIKPP
ncbi:MAG: hypothetical protein ACJ786_09970 [Catenulispora sp.]